MNSRSCLASVVVLGFVSTACGGGSGTGGTKRASGPRPLPVRATTVELQEVAYNVRALGSLEADEIVQVTAEVSGAVKDVLFNAGDAVAPSTVLARIDPDRYRLEAARAEAAHRRAVADWTRAKAELERREQLAREQLVADEELSRARQEAERLAADSAAANAALGIALQNQARSEVRPLRAGVINTRSVDTGQFVQAGDPVATLVDIGRLRLRFKVSDAESLRVTRGQQVGFRVASLGNKEFTARVFHVGEVADPTTRQVEVLAWVANPGELKPGFFAEIALTTTTRSAAAVVPESAIQASERGFVVYLVEEGKARLQPVQIGLRTGDGFVEVTAGLKGGETVVVEGSDRLADGIPLEIRDNTEAR
ncbi:MAG: efflux RND transporter periplasmic adaptor subunit [Acidobacteriota bacterium]